LRCDYLTPRVVAMELCRIVYTMPWELKGPEEFCSDAIIDGNPDMSLSLDDFAERYLHPMAQSLVLNRKELETRGAASDFASIELNGCMVMWRAVYDVMTDSHRMVARLLYRPTKPDRSVQTYFWIGELAEAA
jgi:hypothetical protein